MLKTHILSLYKPSIQLHTYAPFIQLITDIQKYVILRTVFLPDFNYDGIG